MGKTTRTVRYEIRIPMDGAAYPVGEGNIISRHRTLRGARAGLEARRRDAARLGGYSQAVIYDVIDGETVTDDGVVDYEAYPGDEE